MLFNETRRRVTVCDASGQDVSVSFVPETPLNPREQL